MTKAERDRRERLLSTLQSLGFTVDQSEELRRISNTLRRWYELECGDGHGCIERDEETNKPYWVHHYDSPLHWRVWVKNIGNVMVKADRKTFQSREAAQEHAKKFPIRWCPEVRAKTRSRRVIPNRETGARKRLAKIMARYDGNNCHRCEPHALQPCGKNCGHVVGKLSAYIQTDPRGAALYILRPGDVPTGCNPDSYYDRGICVY